MPDQRDLDLIVGLGIMDFSKIGHQLRKPKRPFLSWLRSRTLVSLLDSVDCFPGRFLKASLALFVFILGRPGLIRQEYRMPQNFHRNLLRAQNCPVKEEIGLEMSCPCAGWYTRIDLAKLALSESVPAASHDETGEDFRILPCPDASLVHSEHRSVDHIRPVWQSLVSVLFALLLLPKATLIRYAHLWSPSLSIL